MIYRRKQTLFIIIGKIPTQAAISEYNASDIRTNNAGILDASSLQSRLVVAGGAGWYGGGGGALAGHKSIFYYSGGGGGSSYTHPTLCSSVVHTQGFNKGNGYVKISMVE